MALNTYLDRKKNEATQRLTPTLQAPKPLTQAGGIYQERVTQNLLKPNPVVQNAQNQTDTNISRRNYLTRKQASEDIAQSPFSAGTQQATRLMDQSRAGANMANLNEQQATNNFALNTQDRDLSRANALEESAHTKAMGERTNNQIERGRYSSLIQDPKARYAYNRMVADGLEPSQAYSSIVGDKGSIGEDYRGMSPVGTMQEDAREWIQATTELQPGTPDFEAAVKERITSVDAARQEPLDDASEIRQEENESKDRVSQAVESGDFSQLTSEDFTNLNETQISQLQQSALNKDGQDIKGDNWDHQAGIKASRALERWSENNPGLSEENTGKVVKYGDNHYILTNPAELTGGKDDRKIQAKGINIRTGKEEVILRSSEFDTEFF